jgi:hypothetical protein
LMTSKQRFIRRNLSFIAFVHKFNRTKGRSSEENGD